jgi:hypothetical protein
MTSQSLQPKIVLMKRINLCLLFLLAGIVSLAQSSKSLVTWTYSTVKLKSGYYEVHMTAKISTGYRIYSQNRVNVAPTVFTFVKSPFFEVEPTILEFGTPISKMEWGMWKTETRSFEKTVDFVVKVKPKGKTKTNLYGKVKFIVANDSKALPPSEVNFVIPVGE